LSSYIVPQIPFNPLVDNLGLPIYLRVIAGARCQLCPHQPKQLSPKCPYEPTVPVTDDVLQKPMKSEDLPEENLGYLNCTVLYRYGIEVRKLGQSVDHYIDKSLPWTLGRLVMKSIYILSHFYSGMGSG
jgi:hypothetical protein